MVANDEKFELAVVEGGVDPQELLSQLLTVWPAMVCCLGRRSLAKLFPIPKEDCRNQGIEIFRRVDLDRLLPLQPLSLLGLGGVLSDQTQKSFSFFEREPYLGILFHAELKPRGYYLEMSIIWIMTFSQI